MQGSCYSLLIFSSLLLLAFADPIPTTVTTSRPKLVVSFVEEPKPMMYHFIVDNLPSTLGQNHYLKPGQVVGSFNLDSDALIVRQDDSRRPISSKLNILFVAHVKEQDASSAKM